MKLKQIYLTILCGTLFSLTTLADDYTDASLALCEKVKSCAIAQMGEQEITPEVRQMMQPMLDNMCTSMLANLPEVAKDHATFKPAMACMSSLEALSCEEMQGQNGSATPACKEYEELAEKYDSP
jgi:hypothetical protein